jgi:pteridine reductase
MMIKNRKVLVTGGAVRIGREICRFLAKQNIDIIIHCCNSISEGKELLKELNETTYGNHRLIQGDLLDIKFQKKIFEKNVDILINNASCFDNKIISEESCENAKKQFDVNFWVPFNLMKLFEEQNIKDGIIINILDSTVFKTDMKSGAYSLSKKALAELTKLTALQWAPSIRVNGIAPGYVLPPIWLKDSKMEESIKKTPMLKPVTALEIAETCLFIINSKSITGEIINIDGGVHL